MKKTSIIIVAVILLIIALLPVVGNKFMQNYIQESMSQVNKHGLKLESMKTDSGYLNTKKHLEFVIEDSSEAASNSNPIRT